MDGAAAGLTQTTVSHMQTVIRPISRESALDLVHQAARYDAHLKLPQCRSTRPLVHKPIAVLRRRDAQRGPVVLDHARFAVGQVQPVGRLRCGVASGPAVCTEPSTFWCTRRIEIGREAMISNIKPFVDGCGFRVLSTAPEQAVSAVDVKNITVK